MSFQCNNAIKNDPNCVDSNWQSKREETDGLTFIGIIINTFLS